jgi:phosphoadenosine phosphosulfate reductase
MLLFDSELPDLIERSLQLLKEHEPSDGYYGCFSGGKDSIVIKSLAEMAGVRVDWHYNKTTIDPPELVRFIRKSHPDVMFVSPKAGNFFRRMEKRGFPTRRGRWCCKEYKEQQSPPDRTLIMGIRAEESVSRAKMWSEVTPHWTTNQPIILPIFYWCSDEIWQFIHENNVDYCSLYDEGFHRLGCIGCPMAREAGRRKEFDRWPRYERLWKRSFERIWNRRSGTLQRNGKTWFGDVFFDSWEEMWEWWMSDLSLPIKPGSLFDDVLDED